MRNVGQPSSSSPRTGTGAAQHPSSLKRNRWAFGLLDRFQIVVSQRNRGKRPQVASAAESSGLVSGESNKASTKAGFAAQADRRPVALIPLKKPEHAAGSRHLTTKGGTSPGPVWKEPEGLSPRPSSMGPSPQW